MGYEDDQDDIVESAREIATLRAELDSEASEHARTREQRDDHALREEEANDRWRNVRTAVGEAYGEMDRFDDDPPEFIRWAHKNEQTEFWGRKKAEAALAAANVAIAEYRGDGYLGQDEARALRDEK